MFRPPAVRRGGSKLKHTGEDFEEDIKAALKKHRIDVTGFPYNDAGVYINYLDTDDYLLLPVFGAEEDIDAVLTAEKIFKKKKEVIPVNIKQIVKQGGALNCISWEL